MSTTDDLVAMAGGDAARVWKFGKVPPRTDPRFDYPYRVIGYAPNAPQVRTQDGAGSQIRRFTVQHFGKTTDSVEAAADDTFATFDGQRVYGDVCTQETATLIDRDPDDRGVLSTTHTYRF